jgi:hypothetical protein
MTSAMTTRFILNLKEHVNTRVDADGYTSIDLDLSAIVFRQIGNLDLEPEDQEV